MKMYLIELQLSKINYCYLIQEMLYLTFLKLGQIVFWFFQTLFGTF